MLGSEASVAWMKTSPMTPALLIGPPCGSRPGTAAIGFYRIVAGIAQGLRRPVTSITAMQPGPQARSRV